MLNHFFVKKKKEKRKEKKRNIDIFIDACLYQDYGLQMKPCIAVTDNLQSASKHLQWTTFSVLLFIYFNPLKLHFLSVGHKQEVQSQISHSVMWCLVRFCTVCLHNQDFS